MNALPNTQHIEAARQIVLRQIDAVGDWLAAQCLGATQIKEFPPLRNMTVEDFKGWPVSWLITVGMDLGQPLPIRGAALDAIGERFLATDDAQAEVIRVANRLAAEDAAADEQDARERREEFARVMDAPALALVVEA